MPWTRLDDGFPWHPKTVGLSDVGFRLFVSSLVWSVSNLTDGLITPAALGVCLPSRNSTVRQRTARELVEVGLWSESGVGWRIHDFEDYQETKEVVEERRSRWRTEKKKTRSMSGPDSVESPHVGAGIPSHSPPLPEESPLPLVEETTVGVSVEVFSEEMSDVGTGYLVWTDERGKRTRFEDRLFEETCSIWGVPRTGPERKRRNVEVSELRRAGLPPEALKPLVEKAVLRWEGRVRPNLSTIVKNLGDLLDGFDISEVEVRRLTEEEVRLNELAELRKVEERRTRQVGR